MRIDYAGPRHYAENCFRENAIHAAHGAMTEATLSDLSTIGQGSAWGALRGIWDFLEPKIGRPRSEECMYAIIQVLNVVGPATKSAIDGYAMQARIFSDDRRLDLVAFFIERIKYGFLSGAIKKSDADIMYDVLEAELRLLNMRMAGRSA